MGEQEVKLSTSYGRPIKRYRRRLTAVSEARNRYSLYRWLASKASSFRQTRRHKRAVEALLTGVSSGALVHFEAYG